MRRASPALASAGVGGLLVALAILKDRAHQPDPIDSFGDGRLVGLVPSVLLPFRFGVLGLGTERDDAVEASHGKELEGQVGDLPRVRGFAGGFEEWSGVRQGQRHPSVGLPLELLPVRVTSNEKETVDRILTKRGGVGEGLGQGGLVEIGQHRASARVHRQTLPFLSGVFESEEERFGRLAACPADGFEKFEGRVVDLLVGREPILGERPAFVEVGRHEMHHLVKRRCQRHLTRGHGRPACVCGLKHPGVDDHLVRRR